jgi:hypothetical protein
MHRNHAKIVAHFQRAGSKTYVPKGNSKGVARGPASKDCSGLEVRVRIEKLPFESDLQLNGS